MERKTQQKSVILHVFETTKRPLTIKELFTLASEKYQTINLATVYRNVNKLIDQGIVRELHFENHPSAFELHRQGHCHYFICTHCEKIFPLTGCCGGFEKLIPPHFTVLSHSVTLYGLCEICSFKEKPI